MSDIPKGYCQCGCGQKTKISNRNRKECGWVKGKPLSFINNHHSRKENHHKWNGGVTFRIDRGVKYKFITISNHPRSHLGYIPEHVYVAEKVLGKYLPDGAMIHHVDGDGLNNSRDNLVICQDNAYHKLLHRRQRAYEACGNPDWRKCPFCKKYDSKDNLVNRRYKGHNSYYHRECSCKYLKERYLQKGY